MAQRKSSSPWKKKLIAIVKRVIQRLKQEDLKSKSIIGASFVKMILSKLLYQSFPKYNEGKLTAKYMKELQKLHQKLGEKPGAYFGDFLFSEGVRFTSRHIKKKIVSFTPNVADRNRFAPSSMINKIYNAGKFQELEAKIKYKFNDRALLLQAFTNGSHKLAKLNGTYQRLEFLGDAVLEFLVVRYLYEHPSKISNSRRGYLRTKLISNATFASLSVKHGLTRYYLYKTLTPGKRYYADIFESLAGAIYLDSGRDLKVMGEIYYKLMKKSQYFKEVKSYEDYPTL